MPEIAFQIVINGVRKCPFSFHVSGSRSASNRGLRCSIFTWALGVILVVFTALSASATTVVPPDFAELVNESDYVVRGSIKSVVSESKTTPGGGHKIVTKIEVEVLETILGNPPARVVLQMLGGKVGDEELVLEGAPQFKVGDEDILFISGNGRTICPLYAMKHGRYPIEIEASTGRRFVARANKVPLENVQEVSTPLLEAGVAKVQSGMKNSSQALTPAQFVQQIKSGVSPNYRREKAK